MKIEQFIADVKEALNVQTDDTRFRNRHIFSIGKMVRNELARQEANKDMLWNASSAQPLLAFKLKEDTISENQDYQASIKVYKSELTLPTLLDTKYGKIVHNVFTDNGDRLEPVEYADWIATRKRRYKLPGIASYMIRNNRLYVLDYTGGPELFTNIEAIFEDPEQVETLNNCDACMYVGDMEFNMAGYLGRRIIELTAQHIARGHILPADTKNDGRTVITSPNQ
jgi:hypothetical protein